MPQKEFIFLRHAKLDLPYRDHAEMPFSIFADLGTGVMNPPIDVAFARERIAEIAHATDLGTVSHVLASPSQRCQETASMIAANRISIETLPELAEVLFDLREMNSNGELEKALGNHDIATVNNAVFRGMVSGNDCEQIEETYKRVSRLFEILRSKSGPCVCITHDFYMRVIEIFIRRGGAAFTDITLEELQGTQRNTYLSGFATDASLGLFTSLGIS